MDSFEAIKNKIENFLKSIPYMNDSMSRQMRLKSANLDKQLLSLIKWDGDTSKFVHDLVTILIEYGQLHDGRDALERVLNALKGSIGKDKQKYCDELFYEWRKQRILRLEADKILIYERNDYWQKVYKILFKSIGFTPFIIKDYTIAIEILKNREIDLIITELDFIVNVNGWGYYFLDWVKTNKPSIPTIVVTEELDFLIEELLLKGGINEILVKNQFGPDEFIQIIHPFLSGASRHTLREYVPPIDGTTEEIEFKFAGDWNIRDFTLFFELVRNAYLFWVLTEQTQLRGILRYGYEEVREVWEVFREMKSVEISHSLEVQKIIYASPGGVNFRGIGEPIKELRQFFNDLILSVARWKKENAEVKKANVEVKLKEQEVEITNLEIEEKQREIQKKTYEDQVSLMKLEAEAFIELEEKKLKLIEKRMELLKKIGTSEEELGKLLKRPLVESIHKTAYLIEEGKLMFPQGEG